MATIQIWVLPPERYLKFIGAFIVSMTHVETYFRQLLWKTAGLDPQIGVILTNKLGIDDAMSHVQALYKRYGKNQLVIDDIVALTKELSSLKEARNHIAHRQWDYHPKRRTVILSHRVFAKSAELAQETPYTVEKLEQLCVRAHVLGGMILRHLVKRELIPILEAEYRGEYALPPAPWLEKSLPREGKAGTLLASTRTRQRQHRPSRK